MNVYSGNVDVVVRMRYSVTGMAAKKLTKPDILQALKDQSYDDIIDTEELEILKVEKMDLEAHEDAEVES